MNFVKEYYLITINLIIKLNLTYIGELEIF